MRRKRRFRLADLPRLLAIGVVQLADLFGGRYRRTEGAHFLAVDESGRILVVRTTYLGRQWMLPGGRVERGETPHQAAAREAREETGLTVTVARLRLIDAHHPRDVSFVFGGRVVGGSLDPQLGEIAEVGWLSRAEIAVTSPRLHRMLELIDEAGDGVRYLGLPVPDEAGTET
jgi:ADP-ribose pyrophosphatase YjhB (NUDIX family)